MPAQPPAPERHTQNVLAEIWCDILELPRVGPQDNFFDLGGHSVLLHMVRDGIAERLGKDVPLVELFTHTTISSLARHLDGAPDSGGGGTHRPPAARAGRRARLGSRRARGEHETAGGHDE
ncbi:phosphopantetheine-binding protein [Streptomyces luteocolor]|uniref:phosphopantetheine-binding protein n=1 Tax=Streptomyces luteocolor TaxID=285500 RepID=UPI0008530D49|nr:phosphopantetheine-binding protein [Streptomyces luteocolor]